MGKRARLLTLVLVAVLVPVGAPATAAPTRDRSVRADPPTRTVAAARLPRGRDTAVDFMQDGVIHADGHTIAIRTPVNGEQRQLLGETREGWLVAVRKGYRGRVIAARRGHRPVEIRHTRTKTYGEGDAAVGWLLSRDGEMLVSTTFDRGGTSYDAQDLAGHRLGSGYDGGFFTPFDADDGHVITRGENGRGSLRVVDWAPPRSQTTISQAGDLRLDPRRPALRPDHRPSLRPDNVVGTRHPDVGSAVLPAGDLAGR